jgi:hypothetical protein
MFIISKTIARVLILITLFMPIVLKQAQSETPAKTESSFSEEERRKFFNSLVEAGDKAQIEADIIYPIRLSKPNYK